MCLVPASTPTATVTTTSAAAIATTMASATTPAGPSTAATRTSASPTAVAATIATAFRSTRGSRLRLDAIEVGLVALFEFSSAFERQSRRGRRNGLHFGFNSAIGRRRWLAAAHLCSLFFQNSFARKSNAVAFNSQHLHQHLVAFLQFVANIFYAMFGDFADVQQAFGAGNNFDECAEVRQPGDFAKIGLPYFRGRRQITNDLQRLVRRDLIVRRYIDLASVFDVNFDAGLLDDRTDHLASGPNHVANLIHRNLQGVDTGRVGRNLFAMGSEHFIHLAKDEQASTLRLGQGLAHDLRSDAADLDIHLQSGDALFGPCDFEVHIAVVIFGAGNIRQDGIIIAFLN